MKFICIIVVLSLYFQVESRRILENQDSKKNNDTRHSRKVITNYLYFWPLPINYFLDKSLSNFRNSSFYMIKIL
jgi:hypothetical protein